MVALAITRFSLSAIELHISRSVVPYFGSEWVILHWVDSKKSFSNETSLAPLYVLFSPSYSLTSTRTFDAPATTVKSDMFKEFLMSPEIGRSGVIVALIS